MDDDIITSSFSLSGEQFKAENIELRKFGFEAGFFDPGMFNYASLVEYYTEDDSYTTIENGFFEAEKLILKFRLGGHRLDVTLHYNDFDCNGLLDTNNYVSNHDLIEKASALSDYLKRTGKLSITYEVLIDINENDPSESDVSKTGTLSFCVGKDVITIDFTSISFNHRRIRIVSRDEVKGCIHQFKYMDSDRIYPFIGKHALSKKLIEVLKREYDFNCDEGQCLPESLFKRYDIYEVACLPGEIKLSDFFYGISKHQHWDAL